MYLGKRERFFRLMSEEEKKLFSGIIFSTPFSTGNQVLHFSGAGHFVVRKRKVFNCICHVLSSAIYFPSSYSYLLVVIW